tara:strand:+ start:8958 stop:11480 length:2523 start_codon:yes stop_codon:yes gene_type:complete
MTKKIFISYSHKDEKYREDFGEHLSMLQRNKVIECWHDRKILPSEDWKNTIDHNLDVADIIIFLVSPSFLASDYCYDVEVKRAIERHNEGSAKIISVIIRDCDWAGCSFSRFQAVPKNVLPISKWDDNDTAWLDVINGIKSLIQDFTPSHTKVSSPDIQLRNETLEWLDDTEIILTHPRVNRVLLSHIFVSPDMEVIDDDSDEYDIESSELLLSRPGKYLISGDEQQGKTSLLKFLYKEFLKQSVISLYLDAKDIKKSDPSKLIAKATAEQFSKINVDILETSADKVLLIDNFDEIGLNQKHQDMFLHKVHQFFDKVVITCNSSFDLMSSELETLGDYRVCRLLGLGHLKREEIAKKWISLGIEESIEDEVLYRGCDELKARLDTAIKKNLLPPKPANVLILIQIFEAYRNQSIDLTSYGHCYQELIYQSLRKIKVKNTEYDRYFNFMTEFAWAIYKNEQGLNQHQQEQFFSDYQEIYLKIDGPQIIKNLLNSRILVVRDSRVKFKYPYIYYFFVGKKVAESYSSSPDVAVQVDYFLKNLHREDFAYILIFITHHTKEAWLISKINDVLGSLFSENEQATLKKNDLLFIANFIQSIPELVLEQREIQEERDNHNKRLDEIDRVDEPEESEPLDILASINKALKGMDIAGQIIRNRHASLTRTTIHHLAESGIATGLRFLDYFIRISDSAKNEIIDFIRERVDEYPTASVGEISQRAEVIYLQMTYGAINAIVRKIASSIGSRDAREIFVELESQKDTPAYTLINQAIELQHERSLNMDSISHTLEKIHDNPVCLRILKEMVVQHVYMFPVGYKEKQQLSEKLGFSINQQRLMDRKTRGKG